MHISLFLIFTAVDPLLWIFNYGSELLHFLFSNIWMNNSAVTVLLEVQYLSNRCVWITASSFLVFLHANIFAVVLTEFSLWYVNVPTGSGPSRWLQSCSAVEREFEGCFLLLRFSDAAEKCYQGIQRHALKMSMNGLCPCSIVSCPEEWRHQRGGRPGVLLGLLRTDILHVTLSCTSSFHYWLHGRSRN